MTAIALVTCTEALELDDDLAPLIDAAGRIGLAATPVAWDDPGADWARFDAAILRSAWDYPPRRDEFLAWADRVATATRLFNPPPALRWNTDKHYLADLAAAGVDVVPTQFLAPGDDVTLPAGEYVVKPSISAGAKDTARYRAEDAAAAEAHIAALHRSGRLAMVQPYLAAIDEAGETGLVYLGGDYSHAFTKGALLHHGAGFVAALFAEEEISPATATVAQRRVADATVAEAERRHGRLLYARVDVAPLEQGRPVVLELEITEPSLYHAVAPGSADRFAGAIARSLLS